MKKSLLIICASLLMLNAEAATHTVSNATHLPAQFATVQAAIDAASGGDTLLIHNTGIPYETVTLNKELHLFGSTSIPGKSAKIESLILDGALCSGASFTSLQFNNINTGAALENISDVIFRRCHINQMSLGVTTGTLYSNWLIEGCVFMSNDLGFYVNVNYGHCTNFVVRNNIFYGYILGFFNSQITHNVFTNTVSNTVMIRECSNSLISNNIFYGSAAVINSINVEVYNNISFGTDPAFSGLGSSIISNNVVNQNPMFVNVPLNQPYSIEFDFSLQAGSPAIGIGTDAENAGVDHATTRYRRDYEPDIPVVRSITIPGGNTVPAEGSFQINVNSVSHQ